MYAGLIDKPGLAQRPGWGARGGLRDTAATDVIVHAGQALVSAYPNRSMPQVMPADPRELRDLEDWAAQVAALPAPSPPPALFTPFLNFGFGIGGHRDDWQDRSTTRDPATRKPD